MYRVAISGDFLKKDGSLRFPDVDLSPLKNEKNLDWQIINNSTDIKPEELAGYDALILLGGRFVKTSPPSDGKLSIIARFGVGYDSVNLDACNDNSIALVITPDGIRRPVAVSVLAFMLSLTGNMLIKDQLTRKGLWNKRTDHMGKGLVNKTLGFLGLGNIGAEVVRLALPLDMNFIACDPYINESLAKEMNVKIVDINTLFSQSDILSINCALTEETKHIVNAEKLSLMKKSSYLINTSRGPVVDQDALYNCLASNKIAGAGLDVFEKEPPDTDEKILKLENVILAPHSLCWTDQMFNKCGEDDMRATIDVMHGKIPKNIVNKEIINDKTWINKLENYKKNFQIYN